MNYKLFIYLKAQAAFWEETHSKEGEREMHKSCKEKKSQFPRRKGNFVSNTVLVTKIYFLS